MAYLDDITAAAAALNALTAQEAAQKAAIDAAVAAALAAILSPSKTIHIDQVAGSDANDGTTPQKAVATASKAVSLISAGQAGALVLHSDITIAAQLNMTSTTAFVGDGVNADGSIGTRRKVTVLPAAYTAVPQGNWGLNFFGRELTFYGVELHNSPPAGGASAMLRLDGFLNLFQTVVSWDAGCTTPLIAPQTGATAMFTAVTLPSPYAGLIFQGVTAGANPNTPSLRTNLTTA